MVDGSLDLLDQEDLPLLRFVNKSWSRSKQLFIALFPSQYTAYQLLRAACH